VFKRGVSHSFIITPLSFIKERGTKVEDSSRGEVTIYLKGRGQGDRF